MADRVDVPKEPVVPAPRKKSSREDERLAWQKRAQHVAQQLAAIVESSDDAIISIALDGTIMSWNHSAQRLFGYTEAEAIGQPVHLIYLDGHKEDEAGLVLDRIRNRERIDHYETRRQRKDGTAVDISLSVSPIFDLDGTLVGASKIARDITDRKRAEDSIRQYAREQTTLFQLTDALYHGAPMPAVLEASITAINEALHCDRAAIALFDASGNSRTVAARRLSDDGRSSVAWQGMWHQGEADGSPMVVGDISEVALALPEIARFAKGEGIEALVLVPIAASMGVEGTFIAGYGKPHAFSEHEIATALSICRQIGFGIERQRAEQQRDQLVVELGHRVKNTLANVLAIAQQTFRKSDERERVAFEGRILALAQTHNRLAEASWSGVKLEIMLRDEFATLGFDTERAVHLTGPSVVLVPRVAVILGVAFHELATNAVRHGSLSAKSGKVDVTWQVKDETLAARWTESDGPPVQKPTHVGFGRTLLERVLRSDLNSDVNLRFLPSGVTCEISASLK
jgi:PAS domain S-box-containing protein